MAYKRRTSRLRCSHTIKQHDASLFRLHDGRQKEANQDGAASKLSREQIPSSGERTKILRRSHDFARLHIVVDVFTHLIVDVFDRDFVPP